jgi:hypothetical protein
MAVGHQFRVASQAIRAVDPNHLFLGCRASSLSTPPEVPQDATPYTVVFSVNFDATTDGLVDAPYEAFVQPVRSRT